MSLEDQKEAQEAGIIVEKPQSESELLRELGYTVTQGYYDFQGLRIALMNRVRNIVQRRNENISLREPQKEKTKEQKYKKEYLDELLPKTLSTMLTTGKITQTEHDYIQHIIGLCQDAGKEEYRYQKLIKQFVAGEEIYKTFLSKIVGIGDLLGANIIKIFQPKFESGDPDKSFPHVSSLWKYCGLSPEDKREHGEKLTYNPDAKVLCWKIADSFIKMRTPVYRDIFDKEYARQLELLQQNAEHAPKNKKHGMMRARRKMVKIFLQHYWLIARKAAGLSITEPYVHDKMGHTHLITVEEALKSQEGFKRKYTYTKPVRASPKLEAVAQISQVVEDKPLIK